MTEKEKIRQWWIYKITNPLGSVYVGLTGNIKERLKQHRSGHKNLGLLYASIKEHGSKNHQQEILDSFESNKEYAIGKELFWVRSYMSNVNKYPKQNGMNLVDGGGGIGAVFTEERKRKISILHKGNKYSFGRKLTTGHIEKIRIGNMGKKVKDTSRIKENNIIQRGKPILQFDLFGKLINEFRTGVEAASALDITPETLRSILRGKTKRPNYANRHYTLKYK